MPGLSNWYQIVRSHASFRWCFLQDFVTPKPFLFLFLLFIDAWCNKTTIRHKCLTVIYVSMHALLLNLLLLQMNDSTIQYFWNLSMYVLRMEASIKWCVKILWAMGQKISYPSYNHSFTFTSSSVTLTLDMCCMCSDPYIHNCLQYLRYVLHVLWPVYT